MTLLPFIALLAWTGSPGADRYTLNYGTTSGRYTNSECVTGTCASVQGLDGQDYFYAVTATGTGGTSGLSGELHVSGQSLQPVSGGLIISANDGTAILDVSNDLKTWAQFTTLTGLQGPTFYPTTTPMFYRLEGTQ